MADIEQVVLDPEGHRSDNRPEPIIFPLCPTPTLGVELEVTLTDPETGALVPRAPELISAVGDPEHFKAELFQTIVELNTDVCRNVEEVRRDLTRRFQTLFEASDRLGVAPVCIGTHPTADWRATPISVGERYVNLVDSMRWPARRLLICGMHVHVGVRSGEHAIALLNAFTVFLPHMLALTASSPYWMGEDTGLASCRVKVFEGLPTAGMPPEVRNWSEFVALMRTLLASQTIQSIREIWWDVRPHPGFGTLEIRVCDGVNTLDEVCAIAAFVQSLADYLQDLYDNGETLPMLRNWTLRENKWRASRAGLKAKFIRNERGHLVSLEEHTHQWLEILTPVAKRLGCEQDLQRMAAMVDGEPNYARQRRLLKELGGSHAEMVKAMTRELRDNRPHPP